MEMGFELVAGKEVHFTPNHFYRLHVAQGETALEETKGEDTFDYNGMLFPDAVVAATGRSVKHAYAPDLQAFAGTPARAVKPAALQAAPRGAAQELLRSLTLWLDTNAIQSQGELQTYYRLQVYLDGKRFTLPLLSPMAKVGWEGNGLFKITLA